MKEVKFLLLCLVVATYTSICWITFATDWLKWINGAPLGYLLFGILTLIILCFSVAYIHDHWYDQELFKDKDDD